LRYRQPTNDTLQITKTIPTKDGGRISVSQVHANAPIYNKVLTRFAPDGTVQWSKKIYGTSPPFNDYDLQAIAEASNGNLAAAGSMTNNTSTTYFIQFFNSSGGFLAQKAVGFFGSGSGNNQVAAPLILNQGTDSLLFVFWHAGGGSSLNEKLFLVSTDQGGIVGRTSLIKAPIGAGVGISSLQIKQGAIKNDRLVLFGTGIMPDRCKYIFADAPSYMLFEFDLGTLQLLRRRDYCSTLSGSATTGAYQLGYAVGSQGKDVNVFLQANGNIVFTRTCRGLESTANGLVNQLFSVCTFDSSFNYLRSECITIPASLLNTETAQELFIDAQGNRHISFCDFKRQQLYYAVADTAYRFLLQKKLTLPTGSPYLLLTKNGFLPKGLFTAVNLVTKVNNASVINYIGVRPGDTASPCFGVNEAVLSVMSDPVTELSWSGSFVPEAAILVSAPTDFGITDYPVAKQDICVVKRICDTITIHGDSNICDLSQPVKITAYKNPLCPGPIKFSFDTTAVVSYEQPDDTTLLLRFDKNWRGTIAASPAYCPTLRDSLVLTVSKPLEQFTIGEDTTYCPGHTYGLAALPGLRSYEWQDGSNAPTFAATGPGRYWVTASDGCGRTYRDTLVIKPFTAFLNAGKDTTICRSEQIGLQATQGFRDYQWSPAYNLTVTSSNGAIVSPDVTTTYIVQAERFRGCSLSDTVLVTVKDCPQQFYVPSAFTPNADGKNDLFKPVISGAVLQYEFTVYNRWGEVVFRTTNRQAGWNGTTKGITQAGHVFVWLCRYQFYNQATQVRKGTFVLIH